MQHQGFETAADALTFIKAGKATITITSAKTGEHFTYKISRKDGSSAMFFVAVLNGPDNWSNYQYIGYLSQHGESCLLAGRKGHPDAPSFKAFSWMWAHLNRGTIPEQLTIQHEGKCCMCARKLTHPESIATGIGPECAKKAA